MKKLIIALSLAGTLFFAGCQAINQVQFYDVTKDNAAYSVKAQGKTAGHGPIKRIQSKKGVRDAGDGMTWRFNLSVF